MHIYIYISVCSCTQDEIPFVTDRPVLVNGRHVLVANTPIAASDCGWCCTTRPSRNPESNARLGAPHTHEGAAHAHALAARPRPQELHAARERTHETSTAHEDAATRARWHKRLAPHEFGLSCAHDHNRPCPRANTHTHTHTRVCAHRRDRTTTRATTHNIARERGLAGTPMRVRTHACAHARARPHASGHVCARA